MKNKKILIIGYLGQMGRMLFNCLKSKYNLVGYDLKDQTNKNLSLSNLLQEHLDLVIDFSSYPASFLMAKMILNNKIPLIIGTSGYSSKDINELTNLAKNNNTKLIIKSNYAYYMNWLKNSLHDINNNYYKNTFVQIKETHYYTKNDLPSATALDLANCLKKCNITKSKNNNTLNNSIISIRSQINHHVHEIELEAISGHEKITIIHEVRNHEAYLIEIEKNIEEILEVSK